MSHLRLVGPLFVLLLCWSAWGAVAMAAEDPDPMPLGSVDYDTIFIKNDTHPIVCTIIDYRSDGMVMIQELGKPGTRGISPELIDHTEHRHTAAQSVDKHGAWQLKRGDLSGVAQTIKWAIERPSDKNQDEVKASALALAEKALVKEPGNTDVGDLAMKLLWERNETKKIEAYARKLIEADPLWMPGYEHLAKVLQADPARVAEFQAFIRDWNKKQPTGFLSNKYLAGVEEKAGNLKVAQEHYFKCWKFYKDPDSALGYARICLARGERDKALAAANDLIKAGSSADEARVIAGSVLLAQGDAVAALELLQTALQGKLGEESAKLARYNLGVAYWSNGQLDQAREQWRQVGSPVADLALAYLDRKTFPQLDALPAPELKQLARQYNACVDLESGGLLNQLGNLDATLSKRNLFLIQLGELLRSRGHPERLRVVAAAPGLESLRWQAYGHLLAGRYHEAETVLDQLPETDGYAVAYRIYAAEGRKDAARARDLFKKLAGSANPPREWMARVAATYASVNDELYDEKFDWPDGDTPGDRWQYSAPGTSIRIHCLAGQLVLEGTQAASQDLVSRAWRMERRERLKSVQAVVDLVGLNSATVGLEILDLNRLNGVALGVLNDNRLGWRESKNGVWGPWQPLAQQVQGTRITLCLDYNLGVVSAFTADNPQQKFPLGPGLGRGEGEVCVCIFGVAEPGVTWRAAVDEMQIQLRPLAGAKRRTDDF
jgi:tetratricopeptide (TPR) repeat protein